MCSKIKLYYQNKETMQEIQVRRVSANEYINCKTDEKISYYEIRKNHRFLKSKSKRLNKSFTASPRAIVSAKDVGAWRVVRSKDLQICDTGQGPSLKKPWEVYWGSDLVMSGFSNQVDAFVFINEKTQS